jgi:hypothetical protein
LLLHVLPDFIFRISSFCPQDLFSMILMMNNNIFLNIINLLSFVIDTKCFFLWGMACNFKQYSYELLVWKVSLPRSLQGVYTNCYSAFKKIPCCSLTILPHYVFVFSVSPCHMSLFLISNLTIFSHIWLLCSIRFAQCNVFCVLSLYIQYNRTEFPLFDLMDSTVHECPKSSRYEDAACS